jgi:hypothetical protein
MIVPISFTIIAIYELREIMLKFIDFRKGINKS